MEWIQNTLNPNNWEVVEGKQQCFAELDLAGYHETMCSVRKLTPQVPLPSCWDSWHAPPQPLQCPPWLLPWKSHLLSWSCQSWHHLAVLLAVHIPAETGGRVLVMHYIKRCHLPRLKLEWAKKKKLIVICVGSMLRPDCTPVWVQKWGHLL